MSDDIYTRLAEPFDNTFTDVRGGVEITYVSGEQVVSRLNEVLGVAGWNFRVLQSEIHAEADEIYVLGEMVAVIDGTAVVRQQFGSQKIKRSRGSGVPLDLGFDFKGASTDAMKKCASWFGVALYLSHKKPKQSAARSASREGVVRAPDAVFRGPVPRAADGPVPVILCQQPTGERAPGGRLVVCGNRLEAVPERQWAVGQLANEGLQIAKYPMCWACFQDQEKRKAG